MNTPNSPCCTWACDGSPGCLAGHDQFSWPVLDPIEPVQTMRDEFDDDDLPWSALDRATSVLIWVIVGLCALLASYLGFVAWSIIF